MRVDNESDTLTKVIDTEDALYDTAAPTMFRLHI
jgi:hypothetical protein